MLCETLDILCNFVFIKVINHHLYNCWVSLAFHTVICYRNWPHTVSDPPQTLTALSISMHIRWTIPLTKSIVLPGAP